MILIQSSQRDIAIETFPYRYDNFLCVKSKNTAIILTRVATDAAMEILPTRFYDAS